MVDRTRSGDQLLSDLFWGDFDLLFYPENKQKTRDSKDTSEAEKLHTRQWGVGLVSDFNKHGNPLVELK